MFGTAFLILPNTVLKESNNKNITYSFYKEPELQKVTI